MTGNRSSVDDRTALVRQHQRYFFPHAKPHAFYIDLIYAIKVVESAIQRIRPIAIDSGIVARAIEASVEFANLTKSGFDILRL